MKTGCGLAFILFQFVAQIAGTDGFAVREQAFNLRWEPWQAKNGLSGNERGYLRKSKSNAIVVKFSSQFFTIFYFYKNKLKGQVQWHQIQRNSKSSSSTWKASNFILKEQEMGGLKGHLRGCALLKLGRLRLISNVASWYHFHGWNESASHQDDTSMFN